MPFKEGIKMSFSKVRIDEVKPKLEVIFSRYGCVNKLSTFITNKSFYELKGKYNQLFMLANNSVNNDRLLEFLSGLLSKGFHPYSVGTPIIIYDRSEILPTLAFGRYLAEMCENKLVISDYNLIYKIIYKKPIYISSAYNYNDVIIVDKMNNFIAYAKVENRKRGVYEVIPVKDIGWYLRRGG